MPNPQSTDSLWVQYQAGPTDELRNRLVERYLPLVRYTAKRIWARLPNTVDVDDLVSAGVFGLMDAIEAFDLTRGVQFETYCVPRIRGAILDELRRMDWVPRLVRLQQRKSEEVLVPEVVSLNEKLWNTSSKANAKEVSLADLLTDQKAENPTRRQQRKDLMKLLLKGLNRTERIMMILYYWEGLTMKEIGLTLDLSESRVFQMHSAVMLRLQERLAEKQREGELVVA